MSFPTTRWSLLIQATLHGGEVETEALAQFYRRYREPLVAFISRDPLQRPRAEDLAQEFFLHVIKTSFLRRADPSRGRFRSYLLGALVRFLSRERAHRLAEKRGAGTPQVSLQDTMESGEEFQVPDETVRIFDREWAIALLNRAQLEVQAAWAARDLAKEFETIRRFLPGAVSTPSYEEAAAALGWTVARLKTEIHRLRQHFRDYVRAEIALTVDAPHEIEAEMAYLRTVLSDPLAST
jgi:RNA polymerase sigma-70 factor (ECF subfamily)